MSWREQLREAILDYRYLLDRGYGSKPSLDLVTGRYGLNGEERLLLFRCIHPKKEVEMIKGKVKLEEPLILDGFNVGLSLVNAWDGEQLFLCDDNFVRDLGLGRKKGDSRLVNALVSVGELLISLGLKFRIVLDSQVSMSGEIAGKLRRLGLDVSVVNRADKEIIASQGTSVTSDFVILRESTKVFDLVGSFMVDSFDVNKVQDFLE
ncbi:hypothetical protein MsedC_1667 [Metallosphaera sedula]|uniref:DUF434 domain-containing protein n=2 Tax=Metallosphaera TaxID=41980 RepID=A0A0K1SZ22_9CREN|nr:hypothetical protein MsedA_1667 [Metallosphaera sedula]QCO31335.1 DUF434 domain-containing protein [Metallosphaera prunae]AKV77610.1 hypothetical protein MsedB_1669 [Metallosphaera sedula]AKV79856.1 hypothetical protein MsedC_1667 [Metallosphaera sedula]AKV82101.1 hypothetical protein MsedD_1668 [Metallosphaera sedula]